MTLGNCPVTVDKVRSAYAYAFHPAYLASKRKLRSSESTEKPCGPEPIPMRTFLPYLNEIKIEESSEEEELPHFNEIQIEESPKEEELPQEDPWNKEIALINSYYENLKRVKQAAKKAEQNPSIEEIREQLRENLGENPLKFWEKDKARCEILLKDPDNVIRVKPMW